MKKTIKINSNEFKAKIKFHKELKLQELRDKCNVNKTINGFWNYCLHIDNKWYSNNRQDLKLCALTFALFELGIIKNLAISMRSRMGKSHIVNDFYSYTIGRNPVKSNIRVSYTASLVEKSSKRIKETIKQPEYEQIFPNIKFKQDRRAIKDWAVTKARESSYVCGGVKGGITGSGADNILGEDDMFKDMDEALSKAYVKKLKLFMLGVMESRFEKGAKRLKTGTRWTKDDSIGEVIDTRGTIIFDGYTMDLTDESINNFIQGIINNSSINDETWIYIKIPGLNNKNISTVPSIISTKKLLAMKAKYKKSNSLWMFETIVQQNPELSSGKLFRKESLSYFNYEDLNMLKCDGILILLDPAGKGSNNTTAGAFFLYGTKGYLIDIVYNNEEPEITKPLVANFIIKNKATIFIGEGNSLGDIFFDDVLRILRSKKIEVINGVVWSSDNKEGRIMMHSDWIKRHIVFPAEYNKNGKRQYEVDSDMDRALKSLYNYVMLVKNQEDDLPDMLCLAREEIPDDYD